MIGAGALAAALVAAAVYDVAIVAVARRFVRRARRAPAPARTDAPGVTILVPLEGDEPGLFDNLVAYCALRYDGPVQLVVGSLGADDAALATARRVQRRHPAADLVVVAGAPTLGPNRKASLLAALARHARHPIVAAVDSDVRVAPDWLRALVPSLLEPGVGLVSCLYRPPPPRTLAEALEALSVATDFCPSVMLASALGRRDIALGASIVVRRATLARVGGFAALVEHLADDHRLGALVRASGERVVLAAHVVESASNPATLAGALRHQIRWARTVRACAPWGYLGNVLTHGATFALITLAAGALLPRALVVLALAVLALRAAAAVAGARALGARLGWAILLVTARDVAATAVWIAGALGNRVEWRGRHYRIAADGRLRPAPAASRWSDAPTFGAAVRYERPLDL